MKYYNKIALLLVVTMLVVIVPISALAENATEKKVPIAEVENGFMVVDNVVSEKQVEGAIVYEAVSPVKVSFVGDNIGREFVYYLPNGVIDENGVEEGEEYIEVDFDVIDYKYYDDDTVYSKLDQPVEAEATYISGNYVTLKEPGIYYVASSAPVIEATWFYIVLSEDVQEDEPEEASEEAIEEEPEEGVLEEAPEGEAIEIQPVVALPTSSEVFVNGVPVSFDAFNIEDNNYFKLRDLAFSLCDTEKKFEVSWDGENNRINLIPGEDYTTVGGEMAEGSAEEALAIPTTSTIFIDDTQVEFTAYNINGNNYFKLRDIAQAFNFGVKWDGDLNSISIDTDEEYVAE